MLGSVEDAEDIVQEALLWRHEQQALAARDEAALLTTVVVRRSLDLMRSARRRRTAYIGEWLPEPVASERDDPALAAERSETLSCTFLLLLERLSPVQRAVFVLREIFDYDYAELARLVGRSPDNCRRIMSRARLALREPSVEKDRVERPGGRRCRQLLQAFMEACRLGSVEGLEQTLSADIVAHSDGGGSVAAALNPISGRRDVARFLTGVLRKNPPDAVFFWPLHGGRGILAYNQGQLVSATSFEFRQDGVSRIFAVRNPEKLTLLARQLRLLAIAARLIGFVRRRIYGLPLPKPDPVLRARRVRSER